MLYKFQKYLAYKRAARNEYSLHSPFMFDLYNAVFKKARKKNSLYDPVEQVRRQLLGDQRLIAVTDFGAGSKKNSSAQRSIASITQNTSKRSRHARFIGLLANYLQCKTIVELGTSMGISTAYLATGNREAKIHTIEGCPETHCLAKENFTKLKLENIQAINGVFDEVLPALLKEIKTFDLLYIDGNHTYEATLRYFQLGLKHVHNDSIMVFDDIYWDEGMTRAWKEIVANEKVTASVDTFEFGIVFFRKELSKQHFILKL